MSAKFAAGTQKIGFFGHPPVRPARLGDYGPNYVDPDAPLFNVSQAKDGRWWVELPHQCDEWTVAGGTKEEAIAEFNAFIGAALNALQRLMEAD